MVVWCSGSKGGGLREISMTATRVTHLHTLTYIFISISLIHPAYLQDMSNAILAFDSGPASNSGPSSEAAEPTINLTEVCRQFGALNDQQKTICGRYPHASASAMQGIELAIHGCKRQFADHRWNCSNLDTTVSGGHPMLQRGYKETAFTQAITAAGVLHQIARACALGKIEACGCNRDPYISEFEWKGCSHDLGFGAKFSRRFLQRQQNDIQSTMQAHNSKIGRKAVIDQKSTKCKCHGMSSSCEIKTCWLSTPDFQIVSEKLTDLYFRAELVDQSNTRGGKFVASSILTTEYTSAVGDSQPRRRSLNRKLVYYERSPTYCDPLAEIRMPGTSGRVCNSTTTNRDSCAALCCGRGYFTKKVRRVEKCNCKFHWCCYVVCEKCEYEEWVTVCK